MVQRKRKEKTLKDAPQPKLGKRVTSLFSKPRYRKWVVQHYLKGGGEQGLQQFKDMIHMYRTLEFVLREHLVEETISVDSLSKWKEYASREHIERVLGETVAPQLFRFLARKKALRVGRFLGPFSGLDVVGAASSLYEAFSEGGKVTKLDFERPLIYYGDLMALSKRPSRAGFRAAREQHAAAIQAAQVSQKRLEKAMRQFLRYENTHRKQKGLPPLKLEKDWMEE